ncbi:hypothetical protein KUL25_10755 [Rhodobacteraceae bacterium N5(2021)]|uniref:Uncharacterized protein n=1 Tax=Gymnodinialimonas phycosphaerae TaxID=2841589 RepID=A0A975TQY8_9RHOB|nr:hypothetical protein [Gymnodinialimonas phycosphaerae]MBY4893244.1 hypothetical protein [Gymnodinialimonas phycosphaerae]
MSDKYKTQELTDADLEGAQGGLGNFEIQDLMARKSQAMQPGRTGVVDHKADDFAPIKGRTGVVDHKADD